MVSTIDSWLAFLLLWLQWTQLPNLPVDDIFGLCRSAVHRDWLYIITISKLPGVVVYRTRNKRDWEKIPSPPSTLDCYGMLSHNNRLFTLSEPNNWDRDRHLIIHELLDVDGHLEWRAVPNARCPVQRLRPAFFGVGNSLVLAGGDSSTISSAPQLTMCIAYDLQGNYWNTATWPALPKPMTDPQSVVVSDCVFLMGTSGCGLSLRTDVFSISIKDSRAAGDWIVNAPVPLPATLPIIDCACHVHGNLVVAGREGTSLRAFVFDRSSDKWLKLPELSIVRRKPVLVHFGGSLLAAGGDVDVSYTDKVEELSLPTI